MVIDPDPNEPDDPTEVILRGSITQSDDTEDLYQSGSFCASGALAARGSHLRTNVLTQHVRTLADGSPAFVLDEEGDWTEPPGGAESNPAEPCFARRWLAGADGGSLETLKSRGSTCWVSS